MGRYYDESCSGVADDCSGCSLCTDSTTRTRYVVARKARGNILPGDLVAVTTGFDYQKGGPRLGYARRRSARAGYGPLHGATKVGVGWEMGWGKHTFSVVHPGLVPLVNDRDAILAAAQQVIKGDLSLPEWEARVDAYEATYGVVWGHVGRHPYGYHPTEWSRAMVAAQAEKGRVERETAARLAAEADVAKIERQCILLASEGDVRTLEGRTYKVGKSYVALHYFSRQEHDCEARRYLPITDTVTGEVKILTY